MKRKYKYTGSDGNGGTYQSITKGEYSSMREALVEIEKVVHRCLKCEAI